MKTTGIIGAAMLIVLMVGSGLAMQVSSVQQQGIRRTALQRHDLSVSGRDVVQDRVDLDVGVVAPRHTHPGEEIVYVIEGSLEYQVEGQPPVTLKAGDVLFIPAGAAHAGEERWQRQRGGARRVCSRKGKAARRAGQVSVSSVTMATTTLQGRDIDAPAYAPRGE